MYFCSLYLLRLHQSVSCVTPSVWSKSANPGSTLLPTPHWALRRSISSPPGVITHNDQVILASKFSPKTPKKKFPRKVRNKKFEVASGGLEPPFPTQHERDPTSKQSSTIARMSTANPTDPTIDTLLYEQYVVGVLAH